jgi:hypothetical protein
MVLQSASAQTEFHTEHQVDADVKGSSRLEPLAE